MSKQGEAPDAADFALASEITKMQDHLKERIPVIVAEKLAEFGTTMTRESAKQIVRQVVTSTTDALMDEVFDRLGL